MKRIQFKVKTKILVLILELTLSVFHVFISSSCHYTLQYHHKCDAELNSLVSKILLEALDENGSAFSSSFFF